jgi:hypothetical protein
LYSSSLKYGGNKKTSHWLSINIKEMKRPKKGQSTVLPTKRILIPGTSTERQHLYNRSQKCTVYISSLAACHSRFRVHRK